MWKYITFLLAFIIKLFVFSPFTLNPHDLIYTQNEPNTEGKHSCH